MKMGNLVRYSMLLDGFIGIVVNVKLHEDMWHDIYVMWSDGKITREYDIDLEVVYDNN